MEALHPVNTGGADVGRGLRMKSVPLPVLTHISAWGVEINNFSFSSFLPDSFLYFASENQKLINV